MEDFNLGLLRKPGVRFTLEATGVIGLENFGLDHAVILNGRPGIDTPVFGVSNLTQKQALEQAEAKITDLEKQIKAHDDLQTQLTEASTNLKSAETARDGFKTRAEDAEGKLSGETARADKAEKDFKAANEKLGDLEKKDKTVAGKATEQMAARGVIPPQGADAEATETANGGGIEALAENFMKASMTEKRDMLAKHGEKLRAHVANLARKG